MRPKCRFCDARVVCRPRRLCWHCYYDPFVRIFYGIQDAADIAALKATPKPATDPTEIPAGSSRVEVYRQRYLRGEHIFCDGDTLRIELSDPNAGPHASKPGRKANGR